MYPTLFDAGWLTLPSYFTMMMLGFGLAVFFAWRDGKRTGIHPDDILDFALYALIWGVFGSRVLHVFADGFFMDYVHLCTDPMLVEGRDLLGRPLSELQSLSIAPKMCMSSQQCLDAQTGIAGYTPPTLGGEPSRYFATLFDPPIARDVGGVCNTQTGLCHPEQDCFRWLKFWSGGLVFYGAFLGAFAFALYFVARYRVGLLWAPRVQDLPKPAAFRSIPLLGSIARTIKYHFKFPEGILKFTDNSAPYVSLAQAFGRLGCFLAGCCFGQLTDHPIGMHFPAGSPAYQLHRKEHYQALIEQKQTLGEWASLAVHPTQLYSVIGNFLIFLILYFVVRTRKRFHGQIIASMCALYGLMRFIVEFWRADYRGGVLGLSTSQLIALPLIAFGLIVLWRGLRNNPPRMDDGANPPLGKPLTETTYQAREVLWDGKRVAPVDGWETNLHEMLVKIGEDDKARMIHEAHDITPPAASPLEESEPPPPLTPPEDSV